MRAGAVGRVAVVVLVVGGLACAGAVEELAPDPTGRCCCSVPVDGVRRYRMIEVETCGERGGTCTGSDEAQCRRADRESRQER